MSLGIIVWLSYDVVWRRWRTFNYLMLMICWQLAVRCCSSDSNKMSIRVRNDVALRFNELVYVDDIDDMESNGITCDYDMQCMLMTGIQIHTLHVVSSCTGVAMTLLMVVPWQFDSTLSTHAVTRTYFTNKSNRQWTNAWINRYWEAHGLALLRLQHWCGSLPARFVVSVVENGCLLLVAACQHKMQVDCDASVRCICGIPDLATKMMLMMMTLMTSTMVVSWH